jgi:hypothetical protein
VTFDQTVELAPFGLRWLAIQRNHVNEQRRRRKTIISLAENAILILSGNHLGDELAQSVQHSILPKLGATMPPGGSNHNMSRELNSRNLREFALYYVSAIFFRALAAFCYAEPVSTSAQNAL